MAFKRSGVRLPSAPLPLLLCGFVVAACADERPFLTRAEASLHLTEYYFATTSGLREDTVALGFSLTGNGDNVRYALDEDGARLATFQWSDSSWTMIPDPRLAERLSRVARDRPQVIALGARVDSAEASIADFEDNLPYLLASDRGTDPWRWRLEGAGDFLLEMERYVGELGTKARKLAGAKETQFRVEAIADRVQDVRSQVTRALGESP